MSSRLNPMLYYTPVNIPRARWDPPEGSVDPPEGSVDLPGGTVDPPEGSVTVRTLSILTPGSAVLAALALIVAIATPNW